MSFRITGLPVEQFAPLFDLSDEELEKRHIVRNIADEQMIVPCRVNLTDSKPGDELLLLNYEHHFADSPYRMRFAIFVRRGEETYDEVDKIPEQLRSRMLAVRAFDAKVMLLAFELVDGRELESAIERVFNNQAAAYLHVHYAAPGCYAARIDRVA